MIREPMTLATDYLLGALAVGLGVGLVRSGRRAGERCRTLWGLAFFALAGAAFAGGTAHGMVDWLGPAGEWWVWRLTLGSIGAASFLLLAALLFERTRGRLRAALLAAAGLKLAAYLAWTAARGEFVWAIVDYLPVLLLILALQLPRLGRPEARWLAAGIVVSLAAAAVQALGLAPHPSFNHNDLYHVIQMVGLALLATGARRLRDAGAGERPA